ncbi:WYL domain-containing protein [Geitlerinema sp. PCC 9228]|uniref:helix-turn-helix transcriptional regulator n=1 Tax=Geitlerinema sp. PCC 9228 TaxID=111611 RepID=UPI0008F9B40D|nr:WYL domain-containing protein [Geitlerinema sp. PCC 9228]
MGRKGQSITLSISQRDKEELENLALEFGMTWGDRPNISKLVEAIARCQLQIAPNHDWSQQRIAALNAAVDALVDAGQIQQAETVAQLLLERSELQIPQRSKLERFVERPPQPWRLEIERYIRRQQPFQLFYQDATEQSWTFTICYAEINTHEQRQYLDCWCEETQGNEDLPELRHNWCLRLDRIPEASVVSVDKQWRTDFDRVEVEIHLFDRLAYAYREKENDRALEWLSSQPGVRRVMKLIYNTFWFMREVSQYGENCIIVSPKQLRDRFLEKIQRLYQRYEQLND